MEKTYKCKNGHKFKKEQAQTVNCPSCGEPAAVMQWNTVEEFSSSSKGFGLISEIKSVIKEFKN